MEGQIKVIIPETVVMSCNSCDHLRYNHDWNFQLPEHECLLDFKVSLVKELGQVTTDPKTECPLNTENE